MTSANNCVSLIGWSKPENFSYKRLYKDTRNTVIIWLQLGDDKDVHGKHWTEFSYNTLHSRTGFIENFKSINCITLNPLITHPKYFQIKFPQESINGSLFLYWFLDVTLFRVGLLRTAVSTQVSYFRWVNCDQKNWFHCPLHVSGCLT